MLIFLSLLLHSLFMNSFNKCPMTYEKVWETNYRKEGGWASSKVKHLNFVGSGASGEQMKFALSHTGCVLHAFKEVHSLCCFNCINWASWRQFASRIVFQLLAKFLNLDKLNIARQSRQQTTWRTTSKFSFLFFCKQDEHKEFPAWFQSISIIHAIIIS